jgi:exonuclease III
MEREQIDVYLCSETWDEGNYVKDIRGYTMFHHNNEEKKRRQGAAIILSPRITKAWKDAGGLPPIQGPKEGDLSGRMIAVTLKFPKLNTSRRIIQGEWEQVVVMSVYHPWDEKDGKVDVFNELLDDTLNNLPANHNLIMGGDINAQVGKGDCEEYEDVMGNWGMKERNDKGRSVLEVYMTHNLCVMNTYFEHKEYWTYQSFNEEKTMHMIDLFVVSSALFNKIKGCQVVRDGITSDHRAIKLTCILTSLRTQQSKISENEIDKAALQEEKNDEFNKKFREQWSEDTGYNESSSSSSSSSSLLSTLPF